MGNWHDYLAQDAILPAAGWLVATAIGIHSLRLSKITQRHRVVIIAFVVVTVCIAGWYEYNGVQTLRSRQASDTDIKTLLALAGVPSGDGIKQGLDRLITRNLAPMRIIPTQEEELAKAISLLRPSLPDLMTVDTIMDAMRLIETAPKPLFNSIMPSTLYPKHHHRTYKVIFQAHPLVVRVAWKLRRWVRVRPWIEAVYPDDADPMVMQNVLL